MKIANEEISEGPASAIAQEPFGCVAKDGHTILYFQATTLPFETDLYTHPPPCVQPLTDIEIVTLIKAGGLDFGNAHSEAIFSLVRLVEQRGRRED